MKKYMIEFDYLRVFAALSVIAIHATGWYIYSLGTGYTWNQLMRYAVPSFIILSGLLLYNSDKDKSNFSYFSFLSKRLNKILIPYLLWSIIYAFYNESQKLVEVRAEGWKFLHNLWNQLIYGTASYHLYFLFIIMQMYLIYPALRWLVKNYERKTLIGSFIVTLLLQSADYLSAIGFKILPQSPIRGIPYFMMFPMWIFYFVFGMVMVSNLDRWKEWVLRHKFLILGLWVVSILTMFIDSKRTNTFSFSSKPSIIFYTILSFPIMYYLSAKLKGRSEVIDKLVHWVSNQSFYVYLAHPLMMGLILSEFNRLGLNELLEGRTGVYVFFVTTCSITFLSALVICLFPLAPFFGGMQGKGITNILSRCQINNWHNS